MLSFNHSRDACLKWYEFNQIRSVEKNSQLLEHSQKDIRWEEIAKLADD